MPSYMTNLIKEILKTGNYINVTTNGTLTSRFNELIQFDYKLLSRLHIAFSLHYDELKRTNQLECFFRNVANVKKSGISFVVQCNLCDSYIKEIDEIRNVCLSMLGGLPQFVVTRDESSLPFGIFTSNNEKYLKVGKEANSALFDFTYDNFNKKRGHYCYAGGWSYKLLLKTGELKRCYDESVSYNIYDNINEELPYEPIGYNCKSGYCANASHFIALGVMPDVEVPSYSELRERKELSWYSEKMIQFFSQKLFDDNPIIHEKINNIIVIKREEDYMEILRREIIIYGVGSYGKKLYKRLMENGITPALVCDNDPKKQSDSILSVNTMILRLKKYNNPLIVVAINDDKIVYEVFNLLKDVKADLCTYYTMETAIRHMIRNRE